MATNTSEKHEVTRDYPVSLKLGGRSVLLIGAGAVARRRLARLLVSGADVTVVSPRVPPEIVELAAAGRLRLRRRAFRPEDLEGVFLVLVAAGDPRVVETVSREARRCGVLVNCAEDDTRSDFRVPGALEAEGITVTVSTNGASPALTARLRRSLERWLARVRCTLGDVEGLREKRRELKSRHREDPEARREALLELALPASEPRSSPEGGILEPETDGKLELSEAASAPPRSSAAGKVYLVGAGPGDPGLLTVRARALLEKADAIYYDRLVGDDVLDFANEDAEKVYVGKTPGCRRAGDATRLMIDAARRGHVVVRLKGGDPMVFGRGGEEVLELARAGVDYELVPGVSALSAVPAAAGIPVTCRGVAREVVVRSGHHAVPAGPEDAASTSGAGRAATYVYFMAARRLPEVTAELIAEGLPPSTPAGVVENGTLPHQRVVTGTLGTIADNARSENVRAPALLVVGDVVRFHDLVGLSRAMERHRVEA